MYLQFPKKCGNIVSSLRRANKDKKYHANANPLNKKYITVGVGRNCTKRVWMRKEEYQRNIPDGKTGG